MTIYDYNGLPVVDSDGILLGLVSLGVPAARRVPLKRRRLAHYCDAALFEARRYRHCPKGATAMAHVPHIVRRSLDGQLAVLLRNRGLAVQIPDSSVWREHCTGIDRHDREALRQERTG
jgi:hypothetical protein